MDSDVETSVDSTSNTPSGASGSGLLISEVVVEVETVIGAANPSDNLSFTG
jgi:hypothetical protein